MKAGYSKEDSHKVRTRYLNDEGQPIYSNRLVDEDSPYLLQHAHNPVDWHPWGAEAFEQAKVADKPVFLSIGYSTCHWCHVMERESFDNEMVASLLNEHFVSIKVDREQRPDLDDVYMTGVQLTTGQGGWPMSNFLTSEGKPFFSGTYFPPADFVRLLAQISEIWRTRRSELEQQADQIASAIDDITSAQNEAVNIDHSIITESVRTLVEMHDPVYGGFGQGMKFPQETNLLLLLYAWQRDADDSALAVARKTLDGMMAGGIYDQVGGGFHRYSTDSEWLVPHFEKMLYNQAQLVRVYSKAYEITQDIGYRRIVEQTLDYVLDDLLSATGTFYSARDADSEEEEGRFYLWTQAQVGGVLTDDEMLLAEDLFGISEAGNFEGRNIPTLALSLKDYTQVHGLEQEVLLEKVDLIRSKLTIERAKRVQPLRDEKIISAWNGMMISALVIAARALSRDDYLQAAIVAGHELWTGNWSTTEKLSRIMLDDHASTAAGLEDYAYLAEGYLNIFDATADEIWLSRTKVLAETMIEDFWDHAAGGFFLARVHSDEPSIARPKSPGDGAIASGNSVALNLLVSMYHRTGELPYREKILATINAFSGLIKASPAAYSYMLLAVDEYYEGSVESVQFSREGRIKAIARLQRLGVDGCRD